MTDFAYGGVTTKSRASPRTVDAALETLCSASGNQLPRENARAWPDYRLLITMENMMESPTAKRKQLEVTVSNPFIPPAAYRAK